MKLLKKSKHSKIIDYIKILECIQKEIFIEIKDLIQSYNQVLEEIY